MEFSRILGFVEDLLSIERFGVDGVLRGGLLFVPAYTGGRVNLYAYDPRDGGLTRLNRGRVDGYARPPYGADRVVFVRDIGRGAEEDVLLTVRVGEPGVEEEAAPGMEPVRVLSVADGGELVFFTASTGEEVGVYAARPGREAWRIASLPGLPLLTSARGGLAAGIYYPRDRPGASELLVVDAGSGGVERWAPGQGSVSNAAVGPGGRIVYVLEGERGAELRVLDPRGMEDLGAPALGHGDLWGYGATDYVFLDYAPDGRLVAIAKRRGRGRVFVDGAAVPGPEGMYYSAFLLDSDTVVYDHNSLSSPTRVYVASLSRGEYRVLLAGRAPAWLGERLGESRYVEYESADGARVPAYVLLSRAAPVPGPTVVLVHGGPFSEDADSWDTTAAALAAAGFHVVMPNYRGSTGYGEEWRRRIIGDPCGAELGDVIAAARWARGSGLASRVYVMGYSYGGYLALCALTRSPGVFEAGVAGASIADWEETYRLSDAVLRDFIDLLFGGRRELWRERSPIAHIDGLREPLCIIHPANDTRTPLLPVLRFIEEAVKKGKSVEAHIAPDMGHLVSTMEDAVKILVPALLFLARMEASTTSGGA